MPKLTLTLIELSFAALKPSDKRAAGIAAPSREVSVDVPKGDPIPQRLADVRDGSRVIYELSDAEKLTYRATERQALAAEDKRQGIEILPR